MSTVISIDTPWVCTDEYARRTGQKMDAVRHQLREGVLPIIQPSGTKGKIFINMIALAKMCSENEENKEEWQKPSWA